MLGDVNAVNRLHWERATLDLALFLEARFLAEDNDGKSNGFHGEGVQNRGRCDPGAAVGC